MMKRILVLVCGSLVVSAIASADPKTAGDWFKQGEDEYNLGNFDKAAEDFKQAFAAETDEAKRPAYLYNVAQAYREGGNCRDAAFFYKRFLALRERETTKPLKASTKAEVERLAAQMDECAKTQPAGGTTSGGATGATGTTGTTGTGTTTGSTTTHPTTTTTTTTGTTTSRPTTTGTAGTAGATNKGTTHVATRSNDGDSDSDSDDDNDDQGVTKGVTGAPKLVSARLVGGGAKVGAGGLSVPVEAAFGVIAGYPITINDKLRVEAGLALSMTPVQYTDQRLALKATASFSTILANAGVTYTVAPKIGVRGDLGLGALVVGGLDAMGNPFTQNGAAASGALTMAAVRIGVSADYEITPNLIATAMPFAFTYAPAKSGLRSDISALTLINFMVGVGYRM